MSHRLQLLISEELNAKIRKAAQRRQVSMGEWVRRAMEDSLHQEVGGARQASDPLARMASLGAPTGDIDDMISEIEAGRS